MNDDQSSRSQGSNKSWLERISQAFSSGPESVEDVLEILRDAESQEIIDTDAMSIIEGAMQVIDMRVDEIMIPRSQMVTVKASQDPKEFLGEIISSAHSRFPVIGDSQDDVIGVLLAKDLLPLALNNDLNWTRIREILRPPTFVPESKRLNQLLKEFKETRNHMAIVVDEYGGTAGLITIEDVLEPYLIQQGYLMRTPRGRVATAKTYLHFGLPVPERSGDPAQGKSEGTQDAMNLGD